MRKPCRSRLRGGVPRSYRGPIGGRRAALSPLGIEEREEHIKQ